jgi:hypothetical protein
MKTIKKYVPYLIFFFNDTATTEIHTNHDVLGQTKKKSTKNKKPAISPVELKELQQRTKKSQEDFVIEQVELAQEYERAGMLEDSRKLLQMVRKLKSDLPGLDKKIEALQESILSDNPFEFELDTSKGWGNPVARVEKGKPIRIQSAGKYRLSVTATLDPKGFPTNDKTKDMARGVRCGALMALIIPVNDKGKVGKPGDQIEIGAGRELTPQADGLLFLAVNIPPGSRSTGKLDIQLSGYVRSPK